MAFKTAFKLADGGMIVLDWLMHTDVCEAVVVSNHLGLGGVSITMLHCEELDFKASILVKKGITLLSLGLQLSVLRGIVCHILSGTLTITLLVLLESLRLDAYYRRCSSAGYVSNVKVPLLCISSIDDPICTREAWAECRHVFISFCIL